LLGKDKKYGFTNVNNQVRMVLNLHN